MDDRLLQAFEDMKLAMTNCCQALFFVNPNAPTFLSEVPVFRFVNLFDPWITLDDNQK